MKADNLRTWLRERGCTFEEGKHETGSGHPTVTARCDGRRAEIPNAGPNTDLDDETLTRIVRELGLDPADLPRNRDPL
jgi:hypothetical protein